MPPYIVWTLTVSFDAGQPDVGLFLVLGGVRTVYSKALDILHALPTSKQPVIFQQPRPGPKLQKGESYLTIGWKQVSTLFAWLR